MFVTQAYRRAKTEASSMVSAMYVGYALTNQAYSFKACYEDHSDNALLRAIAYGDQLAMEVLCMRHNVRIYRFALRLTRDEGIAEDVVNEVFLDAWRGAKNFQAKSKVSTWLLAIAHNKAKDAMQRRCHQYLSDEDVTTIEDTADDPETMCGKIETGNLLRTCLSKLPAAQREILDLVYYHHKSVKEVAHILGAPVGTVKTRMFHARNRLSHMLRAAGFEHAWA